jgi:hypothetical protein
VAAAARCRSPKASAASIRAAAALSFTSTVGDQTGSKCKFCHLRY